MAYLDILNNKGYFGIRIFEKAVFNGILFLKGNSLILKRKKRNLIVHLSTDSTDSLSVISYLRRPITKVIALKNLSVFVDAGVASNALNSAFVTMGIRIAIESILAGGVSRYHDAEIKSDYKTIYDKDELEIAINGIFSISLADIIYSLILELYNQHKSRRLAIKEDRKKAKKQVNKNKKVKERI